MEGIVGREALDDWSPKVTFIATLKRHHVRCFVPSAAGGATNLVPGTVIDRDVVDPKGCVSLAHLAPSLLSGRQAELTTRLCLPCSVGLVRRCAPGPDW